MQEKPVVGLYLDARSPSKTNGGKFPVKVRITFEVQQIGQPSTYISKYLATKQYLSREEFEPVETGKARGTLRDKQEAIYALKAKAEAVINKNHRISVEQFLLECKGKVSTSTKVSDLFDEIVDEKESKGKIGTAIAYKNAKASILKYAGPDLHLIHIDKKWLEDYEMYMVTKGGKKGKPASLATVGFYVRALRRLFNIALSRKLITEAQYPFDKRKGGYLIRKKRTKKKGIPAAATNMLTAYQPRTEAEARAWDFIIFSYVCNGMNPTDMAYLAEANFRGDHFVFIRRKTMDMVKEQTEIEVPISPIIAKILKRRAIHKPYVFGIITDDMDAIEKKKKILNWIGVLDDWLAKIAKKIGYPGKITMYSLRHTFTSLLLNAGVPLTKIKDALGHTTILTTQDYAEDLDINDSRKFHEVLFRPNVQPVPQDN